MTLRFSAGSARQGGSRVDPEDQEPAPQDRDLLLFAAYVLVLVTLLVQGVTFAPLLRWRDAGRLPDSSMRILQRELDHAERLLPMPPPGR
ncbi:MAG: hypothetical protein ACRDPB_01815 [Nocardioidaceae bacterium]